jgi:hypothetical protein
VETQKFHTHLKRTDMKMKKLIFGMLFLAGMAVIGACQKDDEEATMSEQIAEDDAALDDVANIIDAQVDATVGSDDEYSGSAAPALKAAQVATDPVISVTFPTEGQLWPRYITIDYGTENLTVNVGTQLNPVNVLIRGKIKIHKSNPYFTTNSTRAVAFEGFYVNDNEIAGTVNYVNNGKNSDEDWVFGYNSTLKLTTPDGFWVSRTVTLVRKVDTGVLPLNIWDDVITMNGDAVGANSKGWAYSHTITDVVRQRAFRFPVSGTVEVVNNLTTFTLDYGNGTPDNIATITDSNENVYTIILGRKWQK